MAFWSSNKKDAISLFLKSNFGVKPKNLAIYQQAFTHSSITKKDLESNERLEFLGDAILDSIVAEYLYQKYPLKDEGFLTQMKSKIVNRKSLNKLGNSLGLEALINRQKGVKKESIEGNAFEALVGALYIDGEFKKTKQIVLMLIDKHFSLVELEKTETDYKSKLYQWCQKERVNLETRFVRFEKNSGFSYKATLFLEDRLIGEGIGLSKKSAEKRAAKNVFESGVLNTLRVNKTSN